MTDTFAEKAADWDSRERVQALAAAVGEAIVAAADPDAEMTVLDFGAGTGLVSARLAPRVGRIVAVDTSSAMLDRLAAKPELEGRVEPLCRDILREPLEERFDLVVSAMALHHVPDTRRLLESFAAHLRPGGAVALADLDREDGTFHSPGTKGVFHHGFDRGQLTDLLRDAGFTAIRFTTAHTVEGEGRDYPVFLVTARRL